MPKQTISVAVVGVTGAGKSTFIRTITQRDDIFIGEGLEARTTEVASYSFEHNGVTYELIDTPGFDDPDRSDEEILESLSSFFVSSCEQDRLLSGILYLHPLFESRVKGSKKTQLRVFEQLCGPEFFHNVILGTTFWDNMSSSVAFQRETEFFTTVGLFGSMKELGARSARVYQDREACLGVLEMFARNKSSILKIQREVAVEGSDYRSTGAMTALSEEISQLRLAQEAEARRRLEDAERTRRENEERAEREAARQRELLAAERRSRERQREEQEREMRRQEQRRQQEREETLAEERRQRAAQERRLREETQRRARQAEEERRAAEALERAREQDRLREEERQRQLMRQQELQRITRVIQWSRSSYIRRGDSFFSTAKLCNQQGHFIVPWVIESWKCWECGAVACNQCYDSGQVLTHFPLCSHLRTLFGVPI